MQKKHLTSLTVRNSRLLHIGALFTCVLISTNLFAKSNSTSQTERNLALNRAAYHSSCINFDNTAHLATDGGYFTRKGPIVTALYEDSPVGEEKDKAFDGQANTIYLTPHPNGWLQYEFADGAAYAIDRYTITSADDNPGRDPKSWTLLGSNNGKRWIKLDTRSNINFDKRKKTLIFPILESQPFKMFRLDITENMGESALQIADLCLFEDTVSRMDKMVYSSEWISKESDNQWIYVDLGAVSILNRVKLYWGENYAKAYRIEISNDCIRWNTVFETSSGDGKFDDIKLRPESARYVRMSGISSVKNKGYSLVEFEVYGKDGVTLTPNPIPEQLPDGTQYLTGGNWKLQRADNVFGDVSTISRSDYNDKDWMLATVPGTVLTSYLKNGSIPDPNFGDQQLQISESYFLADFWYRNSFVVPENFVGKRVWLNFDGINWKADIYVNGFKIGKINGAFIRGRFDITSYVIPGKPATLAVYIHKNDNPGSVTMQNSQSAGQNGGVLGYDNPTIHAAVGWDWMPTIRGRDIGIQDDVYLSCTKDITITDPFITTELPLPNTNSADLSVKVRVNNESTVLIVGTLKGTINPGNITFSQEVVLYGSERKTITIDKKNFPQMTVQNPKLWWPNGYGGQDMYNLTLSFEMNGKISDSKVVPFGIREVTSDATNKILTIYVNGKRIFLRGGNWGMSESMLRLDKQGYDNRVRLHKEENFTMIRNWVGMTGDDDFYTACDKYGILIWDDFWLANPADGPDPNDPELFMTNAQDKIKRVRNHPALVLYCGRNEANPPASLADQLKTVTKQLDGTRPYIESSADDLVTGRGPYCVKDPVWYFQNMSIKKIHSEMGMPNIPSVESMKAMLPADKLWPINDLWGIHDYCNNSAQRASIFTDAVNKSYGTAKSLEAFCLKAQMVNMENHKAMFEPFAGAGGNGLLLWMSQSAWPSTVWQTYDYYLEQTAGYYGCKRACEPLHILWDSNSNIVKVSNNTGKDFKDLTAEAKIYNIDGTLKYSDSIRVVSNEDGVVDCFKLIFPNDLSSTHFIRLKLKDGVHVLSDNFYWRGTSYQNYQSLAEMNKVTLNVSTTESVKGTTHILSANIQNSGANVALMIRLKMLKGTSNERILPIFYSDNYFSLLPGESKVVTLEYDTINIGGEIPKLFVGGWNINALELNSLSVK